MKTLFATIAIVTMFLTARAGHDHSAFNLRLFDHGSYTVVIDNHPFRAKGMFSLSDLEPGYHMLKVMRNKQGHHYGNAYGQGHHKEVIYKGWISIPPRSVVYAAIDCHSQYDVLKIEPYFCPPSGSGCGSGYGYGSGNGWEQDAGWGYGYTGGNGWGPAPPMPPHPCMGHNEFMQFKSSIASRDFDNTKLQIATQGLNTNYLSSAQIAEIMKMFSFESSRLDFAKRAYTRVTDKQNYHIVNGSFTFDSSVRELQEHIGKI